MKRLTLFLSSLLLFFYSGNAQTVKTEHITGKEMLTRWEFGTIMRPSKSDAASNSTITITGNKQLSSCLPPAALNNGVLPQETRLLRDFFCFMDNTDGGKIVMDLGKVIPVAMVNTYSAHGPVIGTTWCEEFDGARGPQVYTLYGSAAQNPDAGNLKTTEWVKIADVDTRPSDDADWQGRYGVNISGENNKSLGDFRWLVWDVKPTFKPGTDPIWTNTWFTELDVHTKETLANGGDAILAGTQLKEIIVAYKTHFDIGFTHPAPDIVNVYRTSMIDKALDIIDEFAEMPADKRFCWTIPSWVAYQILWDGQEPERRKRVTDAMKNGNIIVHGLPVTVHTESLTPADLVFGLSLNKAISEDLGIPMSRSGKMTDPPCHSWVLPTVLKNAGMDFMHIGTNPCNERPDVPIMYYWEGPDGSQLLTMQPQGYGSNTEFGHGLYPPKDWPYEHWLAILVTSDNVGPPRLAEVQKLFEETERNLPGVKITLGKMEDFADAIFEEEKNGAKIPVVRADMPDTWIHGVASMPVEDARAHKTRADLVSAEVLDRHLAGFGLPRPDISDALFSAHERSLMYGEHTFGGNRNLSRKNAYGKEDFEEFIRTDKDCIWLTNTWQDQANYMVRAAQITDSLTSQMMGQLAEAVAVKGERVVVYNPLPYKRDAVIDVPGYEGRTMFVKDIPASGYKTYPLNKPKGYLKADGEAMDNKVMENKYLKVTVDRNRGGIVSVINKKDGRELVDRNAPYAFGQYFYQRFDSVQNRQYHLDCNHLTTVYQSNGRACWGWNSRADLPGGPSYQCGVPEYEEMYFKETDTALEVILKAKAKGIIESDVTMTVTLPYDSPWLETAIRLDNKKPDYWPEAGSIYLPVEASEPKFRIGRVGGVVDPAKDFARRSNRTYGYVNTGAMIGDAQGKGLAICPLDHGVMSFGEKGLCEIDPDYVPETPLAIVNMFNTLWTINFPYWVQGTVDSRVRLWAVDDVDDNANLIEPAQEALTPVLVGYAGGDKGALPKSQSGLTLSRKGVNVVSYVDNPDGGGDLLRLWEYEGKPGELTVVFPKGNTFAKATPVNLRGEKTGDPIPVKSGVLKFHLNAYAPVSFILE